MKRKISFGQVAIDGYSRKKQASVDIEYKKNNKGEMCFSVCGSVGDIMGGQCLDSMLELPELANNELFVEIHRLWKAYRLNDTHPDCIHQRNNEEFQAQKSEKIIVYKWLHLHDDLRKAKKELIRFIELELSTLGSVSLTSEQQSLYKMKDCIYEHIGEYDNSLYSHKESDITYKTRNWISYSENALGLLSKPCPICGYKYGSTWNFEPIPGKDEKIILALLGREE